MLFIYYKSDGEIFRASIPERNMEEFYGARAEEMSLVFEALYIEDFDSYIFNQFYKYKVNLSTKTLELK